MLLVDDDASSRLLLDKVLASWGYGVHQTSSAADALGLLREHSFDVLVTDLEMPVLSGFVLVRQVRAREERSGIRRVPALAISGHASLATRRECARLGFDRVIRKPFDWDTVRSALREVVGAAKNQPAAVKPPEVSAEVRSLLPSFLAARQADYAQMVSALAERNLRVIGRLGHQLKGSGGSFGFPELSAIGERLEISATGGDAQACADALRALEASLRKVAARAA